QGGPRADILGANPLHEKPRGFGILRVLRERDRRAALVADVRDLLEARLVRRAQPRFRRRTGRLHEAGDLGLLAVEAGEELAPADEHRRLALADRFALAVPGPGLRPGRHVLDEIEHVGEPAHAVSVAAGERAVAAEHRAAIGPQPAG